MSDAAAIDTGPRPLFSATLSPHRSMGQRGFFLVMVLVAALCLPLGFIFLAMGAWPVFGFLGLDIVLVFLAFRLNFFAARAYETVILTPESLTIRHVPARGAVREFVLDPNWTRLRVKKSDDGVEDIIVTMRHKAVAIGRFLPPEEKQSFAAAFAPALARVSQFTR